MWTWYKRKCFFRVQQSMSWPGFTRDSNWRDARCAATLSYHTEPLLITPLPARLWQRLAAVGKWRWLAKSPGNVQAPSSTPRSCNVETELALRKAQTKCFWLLDTAISSLLLLQTLLSSKSVQVQTKHNVSQCKNKCYWLFVYFRYTFYKS